jgi:hypothetical protein
MLNRHGPSDLGSLASAPTPERATAANPGCRQLLEQAVEQPEAQPGQPEEQPVQQPEEQPGQQPEEQQPVQPAVQQPVEPVYGCR